MVQIILLLASYFDVRENRIPNKLNVAGMASGLLLAAVRSDRKLPEAVVGALFMLFTGVLCWIIKAIRGGDAKLLCVLGVYLGWENALNCFVYSLLVAGVAGFPLVLSKFFTKKTGQTEVPFALLLTVGTFLGKNFGFLWNLSSGLF